jgi:hypothetical protein
MTIHSKYDQLLTIGYPLSTVIYGSKIFILHLRAAKENLAFKF